MENTKKYHTVLVKYESKTNPWVIHFGDYSREVALDEADYICDDEDVKAVKVISTKDDQASINAAVEKLNATLKKAG